MIFDIRQPLPDQMDGYPVDLRYTTVLKAFDVMRNRGLSDHDRMDFIVALLFPGKRIPPIDTVNRLFDRCISTGKQGSRTKAFDFMQDGIYIYSSFLMDYGVDLFSRQNNLHWMQFISMFLGLSERTKMREVMSIRQRKIPEPNSHNAEQIAALMEAKAYYALEVTQEEREQNFRVSLSNLAAALRAKAR